jgi:transcription elongation factor GreA
MSAIGDNDTPPTRKPSHPDPVTMNTVTDHSRNAGEFDGEAITAHGLEALKAELGRLETEGRREIAQRILVARGHGDLKENAEYHAAKEDQAHLETQINRLRQRLINAVVIEPGGDGGVVAFARPFEVVDEGTGEAHQWTVVGVAEADRQAGKLSAQSPVGRALLGAAVGEVVQVKTPHGSRRLRVERLL